MKKNWLFGGLVLAIGTAVAAVTLMYILPLDFSETSPTQPLSFSHKLHAGVNSIDCRYCHRHAKASRIAGIPAVADCRSCHLYISPDAPQIKKLMDYWDRLEPIPWVRVNTLPDHVYFPHNMHIRAGIDCSACHGDVATMEQVRRTASLKMGWCLDCHRKNKAGIDCWACHI